MECWEDPDAFEAGSTLYWRGRAFRHAVSRTDTTRIMKDIFAQYGMIPTAEVMTSAPPKTRSMALCSSGLRRTGILAFYASYIGDFVTREHGSSARGTSTGFHGCSNLKLIIPGVGEAAAGSAAAAPGSPYDGAHRPVSRRVHRNSFRLNDAEAVK